MPDFDVCVVGGINLDLILLRSAQTEGARILCLRFLFAQ